MTGGAIFGNTIFGEMANHLWQSTIFAAGVALLAFALRKNRAPVRYWVWLAASAKFLIPFSIFAGIGATLSELLPPHRIAAVIPAPATALAVDQIAEPFRSTFSATNAAAAPAPHATHWLPIVIFGAWACGFVAVVAMRIRGWLRVRAALRASAPMDLRNLAKYCDLSSSLSFRGGAARFDDPTRIVILEGASRPKDLSSPRACGSAQDGLPGPQAGTAETTRPCFCPEVRSCPGLLEPGVVGFWRPVLLLPEGIAENLSPEQLEAVLAHELSHIRRRDNLTALIQMIAEAVFWFYPVVWWIGAKLVEERERACDEAVLNLGSAPRDYADAILNVCKMYVESPVECVAGISGADLKKRVVRIMKRSLGEKLTPARKLLLGAAALAAIAAPLVFGLANAGAQQDAAAPPSEAEQRAQQASQFGPDIKYDVVSIRVNNGTVNPRRPGRIMPDGLSFWNISFGSLFDNAYDDIQQDQILGLPDWSNSERYEVLAKTDGAVTEKLQKLAPAKRQLAREWMMQELLVDRFKLKVHWEARRRPVYFLTIGKDGPKFKEAPANEDYGGYIVDMDGKHSLAGTFGVIPGRAKFNGVTMDQVVWFLERRLGRSLVDNTGLKGHYDLLLHWAPSQEEIANMAGPAAANRQSPPPPNGQPAFAASDPSGYGPLSPKSIEKQLGLHLEAETGPVRVLVIDHVEKPTTDSSDANAIASQDANASQTERAPQTPSAATSQDRDAQNESPATTAPPQSAATPQNAAASTQTQETPQFGPELKYDVASIKPGDPHPTGSSSADPPDGMNVTNAQVMSLLEEAYGISTDKLIIGALDWTKSETYTIDAKMDASVADELKKLKPKQKNLAREQMLRELLADRFGLKAHSETRAMQICELVVAKGGPKLTPAFVAPASLAPPAGGRIIGSPNGVHVTSGYGRASAWGNGRIAMGDAAIEYLAKALSQMLGREVVDKTGITGEYDLFLQWDPGQNGSASSRGGAAADPAFAASTPSGLPGVRKAIEQQLGLELRDATGPVRVIVIDRIEKPTEN